MKLIDKYVINRFFKYFFFALLAALVIYLVVDPIENLDDFMEKGVPKREIVRYYVLFIPYIIYLTFPVAVLLATMFAIGSLTSSNELLAMTASGVSLYRHLGWLLLFGFLLSSGIFWLGETVVIIGNQERMAIWRQQVRKRGDWRLMEQGQVYLEESHNRILHMDRYQPRTKTGFGVDLFTIDNGRIRERLTARQMNWNGDTWVFHDIVKRKFVNEQEFLSRTERLDVPLQLIPEDMIELKVEPEEMGITDLRKFVERIRMTGGVATQWIVDVHSKVAMPMAGVIIILFGVPISAVRRRSGLIFGVTVSLLIAFIYFGLMQTGKVLGYKEILNPFIAAWLGNIVFLVLGVFLLIRVPK